MWAIKRAIHGAGLKYHKEKHFVDRPAEVTGVIISGDSLKVPNRQLKKLNEARAALRHPDASVLDPKLRERMLGLQGQVAQVAAIRARRVRGFVPGVDDGDVPGPIDAGEYLLDSPDTDPQRVFVRDGGTWKLGRMPFQS
jgi:hypothetical protein